MQPNIVLIVCDDLAWGDLASHGNSFVRTPNLDQLSRQGTRFTQYRSGPMCTPARAELMTGRCHVRTGAIDTYNGRSMLRPDEVTVARVLAEAGYATGIFGKWHLGDQPPSRPTDHGFEMSLVHGGGGIGQYGDHPGNTYFDPWLSHQNRVERFEGYCTDIFFDQAIDWIGRQRERPFFAYIAPNCPHTPLQVPDAWVEPYRQAGLNDTFARIYAMVENIDAGVGRLMQALERMSIADDTIVIFTSDHGPCSSANHQGETRFNAGLRDIKGSLYEGGVRVPCIVHWPNGDRADADDARLAGPVDWMPTLARLGAAALPTDRALDGVDLFAPPDANRTMVMQWHRGDCLRRDRNYAVIRSGYKLTRVEEASRDELYRLPDERTNLIDDAPDVAAALRRAYERWFAAVTGERRQPADGPVAIHLGPTSPVVLTRQDGRLYPGGAESWGPECPCRWTLRVMRDGAYRLHLHFDAGTLPATLRLRFGGWELQRRVPRNCVQEIIENVEWAAGEHEFEALLDHDGGVFSVARIEISPTEAATDSPAARFGRIHDRARVQPALPSASS